MGVGVLHGSFTETLAKFGGVNWKALLGAAPCFHALSLALGKPSPVEGVRNGGVRQSQRGGRVGITGVEMVLGQRLRDWGWGTDPFW